MDEERTNLIGGCNIWITTHNLMTVCDIKFGQDGSR